MFLAGFRVWHQQFHSFHCWAFWICNSEKGALTIQRSTHTGSDPEVLGSEQRGGWLQGWPCTIRVRLWGLCPPAGSSDPWVLHSQSQEPPSTHQPELLAHPHTLPGSALREKSRAERLMPPLCLSSGPLLWTIWHTSCKEQILLHICKKDSPSLMYGLSQQGRKQLPFWLLCYLCSALSIDKYLHEWINALKHFSSSWLSCSLSPDALACGTIIIFIMCCIC